MSVRAFSAALDTPASTTRNYLDKGTKPSTDYIERIAEHFDTVNLHWLITGQGAPFLAGNQDRITQTGNFNQAGTGNKQVVKGNKGSATNANHSTTIRVEGQSDLAMANALIEQLRSQLADKERIIQLLERSGK
jgi:hypothetical protein